MHRFKHYTSITIDRVALIGLNIIQQPTAVLVPRSYLRTCTREPVGYIKSIVMDPAANGGGASRRSIKILIALHGSACAFARSHIYSNQNVRM